MTAVAAVTAATAVAAVAAAADGSALARAARGAGEALPLVVGGPGLAGLAGALVVGGIALAARALAVDHVALADALDRLEARGQGTPAPSRPTRAGVRARVGAWLARHGAGGRVLRVPERDLLLVRRDVARHWGDKAAGLLLGLAAPTGLGVAWALAGGQVAPAVPVGLAVALGALGWLLPDQRVRAEAARARDDVRRAVACYVELVALARAAGDGTQQALRHAAESGDTWVFERLREALARAELAGVPPWDGFAALAAEYEVVELAELADVMRLAGEEGSAVYDQLRARARSQREDLLSRDLAAANAADERLTFPVAALVTVFTLLLALPALARLTAPGEYAVSPAADVVVEAPAGGPSPGGAVVPGELGPGGSALPPGGAAPDGEGVPGGDAP